MVTFKTSKTGLELNISIAEAKDLVLNDPTQNGQVTKLNYNPRCTCTILPKSISKTKKVKSSISPNWNETVKLTLRKPKLPEITNKKPKMSPCAYLILKLTVWDCQMARKNYLGELRISVIDILQELFQKKETEYRWFRMYSSTDRKRFVTGSIKCKFSISLKSGRDYLEQVNMDENLNEEEYLEEDEEELIESEEENPQDIIKNEENCIENFDSEEEESKIPKVKMQDPNLSTLISKYLKLLKEVEHFWSSQGYKALSLLGINDQKFYSNVVRQIDTGDKDASETLIEIKPDVDFIQDSDFEESDLETEFEHPANRNKNGRSATPSTPLSNDSHTLLTPGSSVPPSSKPNSAHHRTPFSTNLDNDSRFLLPDLRKEHRSESFTSISSMASNLYSSADEFASDNYLQRSDFSSNERGTEKRRPKIQPLRRRRRKVDSSRSIHTLNSENELSMDEQSRQKYVFKKRRELKGLLFMEIISASGLPPFQNATRTGFDMDPFVVVSFGKYVVRTSFRAHSLNPVFNERLYFEVLETEKNFNVAFDILDKDKLSFNDKVCNAAIPMRQFFLKKHITPDSSSSNFRVIESDEGFDEAVGHRLLRRNPAKNLSNTNIYDDYLTTLEIDMELRKDLINKLKRHYHKEIYNPKIKIRFRYEDYADLRRKFWYVLLNNSQVNTPSQMDIIELGSFLQSVGSNISDEKLDQFFKSRNKNPWVGESLTFDECIDCFEDEIDEIEKNSATGVSSNSNQIHIINIEKCPLCGNSRLSKLDDNDIVTHLAICGSKDWSSVTKILKASYTTSDSAKRRWFSKALIKIAYGRLRVGDNNANILVQDRDTGLLMEEKMSVYVRLGIRLLYRSFENKASNRRKIRKMLKSSSLKQGLKFDNPNSTNLITSFIKFYSLDMSDYLIEDLSQYGTFNEFFYRKLKPNARKIEAKNDNRVATSGADCRCTAFQTVQSATELWIKGRGFTIEKLLGNKYPKTLIDSYTKGSIVIFRLAPQDYHRFHSSVAGIVGKIHYIEGEYYTVNPMAIRSGLDVYGENVRVLVPIITEEFGTVMMCCIGAMMVGSTIITVKEGDTVNKGDEIGYFKFGGSTVVLLFQENSIILDSDLKQNSEKKTETFVRLGMSIGHTSDREEYERQFHDFETEPEDVRLRIMRSLTGGGFLNSAQDGEEISSESSKSPYLSDEVMNQDESLDTKVLAIPSWEVQHLDIGDAVEFEIEEEEKEQSMIQVDENEEEAIVDESNT